MNEKQNNDSRDSKSLACSSSNKDIRLVTKKFQARIPASRRSVTAVNKAYAQKTIEKQKTSANIRAKKIFCLAHEKSAQKFRPRKHLKIHTKYKSRKMGKYPSTLMPNMTNSFSKN